MSDIETSAAFNLDGVPQDLIPEEGWLATATRQRTKIDFEVARYWGDGLWNSADPHHGPQLLAGSYSMLAGSIDLVQSPDQVLGMSKPDQINRYGLDTESSSLHELDADTSLILNGGDVLEVSDNGTYFLSPARKVPGFYTTEHSCSTRSGFGALITRIARSGDLSDTATHRLIDILGTRITEAV